MGKPVHPAAVHFPIAFLTLAFGLDIVHEFSPRLPYAIQKNLPISTDMTRLSYFLLSAGLITIVPALITGIREAVVLISKQGMWQSADDPDISTSMRPKVQAMIAHAAFNDTVAIVATYIWYNKRANAAKSFAGKVGVPIGAAAYQPEPWMVYTEIPLMIIMFMAANIGGVLAYNFGVGFSAGGASSSKKKN